MTCSLGPRGRAGIGSAHSRKPRRRTSETEPEKNTGVFECNELRATSARGAVERLAAVAGVVLFLTMTQPRKNENCHAPLTVC